MGLLITIRVLRATLCFNQDLVSKFLVKYNNCRVSKLLTRAVQKNASDQVWPAGCILPTHGIHPGLVAKVDSLKSWQKLNTDKPLVIISDKGTRMEPSKKRNILISNSSQNFS